MKGIESAFLGVLSKDPECKQAKNGQPYSNFSCAVSGEGDVTQWINVICFGDTARQLTECARKGDRVYVEGSLTLATWQDGEGKPRSGLAVSAWKVEKLFAIGMGREKGKKARKRRKKKLQIVSGIDLDFNDALPF